MKNMCKELFYSFRDGALVFFLGVALFSIFLISATASAEESAWQITEDGTLTAVTTTQSAVTIPDSVKVIGSNAFQDNTTVSVVIVPGSVTTIQSKAFNNCSALQTVAFEENSVISSISKTAFVNPSEDFCFGINSDNTSYRTLQKYCHTMEYQYHSWGYDEAGNVVVTAEKVAYLSVGDKFSSGSIQYQVTKKTASSNEIKCIGLIGSKLTAKKITIPKTITKLDKTYKVTAISKTAFKKNQKVTQITLGANVNTIEKKAFQKCKNLKKIIVANKKQKKKVKNSGLEKGVKVVIQ